MDWLEIKRGDAPLVLALPHTGTDIPARLEEWFVSPWTARRDTDWWIDRLYAFAVDIGATVVRTRISRSVIDVNRDPSGASLYPGLATTELCPTTTFDGEPLYAGDPPGARELEARRVRYFDPYHAALSGEVDRLHQAHGRVVLYDAHSIRSRIPRLFDGELPQFNIGTNGGTSCDPKLAGVITDICAASGRSHVLNGRFRGGWTTRFYGRPQQDVHAVQMELAMRGYMAEPDKPTPANWPTAWSAEAAAPLTTVLADILETCIDFASRRGSL